ncbi:hypothetical protein G6F31_015680 [Rhizopus arrhizus]|nr:hypothetical protein G6F31_015680 [Rhizopus arrhizus]
MRLRAARDASSMARRYRETYSAGVGGKDDAGAGDRPAVHAFVEQQPAEQRHQRKLQEADRGQCRDFAQAQRACPQQLADGAQHAGGQQPQPGSAGWPDPDEQGGNQRQRHPEHVAAGSGSPPAN